MGNVRFGPDPERTRALRDRYGLKVFVETGTFKGATALWAAAHFDWVYTLEGDRQRFLKTVAGVHQPPNVSFLFGDSRTELARVLATVNAPCLLWLDAHWCGGGAAEAFALQDECPLREELAAIRASPFAERHVILIDDARLFTAPPPYPHHAEQWPREPEIRALLAPRQVSIVEDVIYGEPV